MYTEISIKTSKKILKNELNHYLPYYNKIQKKYIKDKYKHSLDCFYILKEMFPKTYKLYAPSVILHDFGCFSEFYYKEKIDHARLGYNLLKEKNIFNTAILLPIKYHEEDVNWELLLDNDEQYQKYSKKQKEQIYYNCIIVRDIDIISNMKQIVSEKANSKNISSYNSKLVKLLKENKIGKKEFIENDFDKIIYILCGLNLILLDESREYIKKHKIIEKLIKRLYFLINNNCNEMVQVTQNIEKIIIINYKFN